MARYEILGDSEPVSTKSSRYEILEENTYSPEKKKSKISQIFDTLPFPMNVVGKSIKAAPQVASDLGEAAINSLGKLSGLPGQISGVYSQATEEPERILKNVGVGAVKGIEGLINTPSDLIQYLSKIGAINEGSGRAASKIRLPNDKKYVDKLMGDEKQGDALIQGLTQIAPVFGGLKGLAKGDHIASIHEKKLSDFESDARLKKEEHENISNELAEKSLDEPHSEEKKKASEVKNKIGKFLNIGAQHDVRAAKAITNRVNSIENYYKEGFKNFDKNIKESRFYMPEKVINKYSVDLDAIKEAIRNNDFESVKKGKIGVERQSDDLKDLMDSAPTSKDVMAADFIPKYRDFGSKLHEMRKEAKSYDVSAERRKQLFKDIDEGEKVKSLIEDTLKNGLGEHYPEFDRLNKGYSEQIWPLRENPVVQKAAQHKLPNDIISSLRTNEKGMPLVRQIVKEDPELLRNVIGQRYESNPKEVHNPNETMQEYINESPELQGMIGEHAIHESNAEKIKSAHDEEIKNLKRSKLEAKRLEKESMKSLEKFVKSKMDKNKGVKSAIKNLIVPSKFKSALNLLEAFKNRQG